MEVDGAVVRIRKSDEREINSILGFDRSASLLFF